MTQPETDSSLKLKPSSQLPSYNWYETITVHEIDQTFQLNSTAGRTPVIWVTRRAAWGKNKGSLTDFLKHLQCIN